MLKLLFLCLTFAGTFLLPAVQAQTDPNPSSTQPSGAEASGVDPNELKPLSQPESLLSREGGQKLMQEAEEAIGKENYDGAADKLQQARRVFNQLSNFHLQLATSFSGIDAKIVDSQRKSALATGQLRDEATYQLALVHRAQNKPELAVPLLIQVIQSQNPTSELGRKSYQQLYELGFVDTPFSTAPSAPAAPAPSATPPR